MNKNKVGALGEDKAAEYLKSAGYEILARNFRSRFGEVDIIARKDEYLCFIEVKTRANNRFSSACEAVSTEKQNRIRVTSEYYILSNSKNFKDEVLQPRFDCVEVYTDTDEINFIENAF